MDLLSLDHVHLCVPDLERAQAVYGPFLRGAFTPVYGGPELNAFGTWNTSGGDFIQPIRRGEPVFGGAPIAREGILSVSFRVNDIDEGIAQAQEAGLVLRSRTGSEEVGFGKNVVQGQFSPAESFGLEVELVERQIPGDPHRPMNESIVDHVEHYVRDLDGAARFFEGLFESPFDALRIDASTGARSLRHPRFGIQLTGPASDTGLVAERIAKWGEGPHAIAFQSRDLAGDVATAESVGLRVAHRRSLPSGGSEVELEPEHGVVVELVERAA